MCLKMNSKGLLAILVMAAVIALSSVVVFKNSILNEII